MGHFSALGVVDDTEELLRNSNVKPTGGEWYSQGESENGQTYGESTYEAQTYAMDRNMTMLESPEAFGNALRGLTNGEGEESKE